MERLTPAERGWLLLTSSLGDPDRKPLTAAQCRKLSQRARLLEVTEPDRELAPADLTALGYGRAEGERILKLLEDEDLARQYLRRGERERCVLITRSSRQYPVLLRRRLGEDAPGCLWARGDLTLLETPAISLVGSRDLRVENRAFAEAAGRQAARQGLTLVSGNARGADKAAQNACLRAGGRVISVVADALLSHKPGENQLYLSENVFDEGFSAQRALSRNRVIHALGRITLVAQSDLGKGGTWDGTVKNLRHGWSPVACFRDGSDAVRELEQLGAYGITEQDLQDLTGLQSMELSFL